MRVFLILALVLAALGLLVAILGHDIFGLTIGVAGWIAASLVAFFVDCAFNGPEIPLVKKSPPS